MVLAALLVGGYLLVRRYAPFLTDAAALREFIAGFGPWAPLAFVAVQSLQVVAAPIPGAVLGFVGGYLFGTVPGLLYSLAGVTVGSYVAYALAGRYGRPYVESVVAPETIAQFDAVTEERALVSLFVVFLVPGLPDDAICFVAGLTGIDRWKLVAIAVLGRAPGFFVASAAGASLARTQLRLTAALVLAVAALSVLGYLNRGRLADYLGDGEVAAGR